MIVFIPFGLRAPFVHWQNMV